MEVCSAFPHLASHMSHRWHAELSPPSRHLMRSKSCEECVLTIHPHSRLLKVHALSLGRLLVGGILRSTWVAYTEYIDRWEFFISLPFDFDFILKKKAFKWPLVSFASASGFWCRAVPRATPPPVVPSHAHLAPFRRFSTSPVATRSFSRSLECMSDFSASVKA